MANIIIYSKADCPYCERAKQLLEHKNQQFTEIRIDQDPEQLKIMLEKSGGARTIPQIFINDQHIGGFDDLAALDQAGKLDSLLSTD